MKQKKHGEKNYIPRVKVRGKSYSYLKLIKLTIKKQKKVMNNNKKATDRG